MVKKFKYWLMFITYLWLRFDLVLRLGFGKNWRPRFDFLAQMFGPGDAELFLSKRVELARIRRRPAVAVILPTDVARLTRQFLKIKTTSESGRKERLKIISRLIFWATDPAINKTNIDSYKTRCEIINSLMNAIFQNSLFEESTRILNSLQSIVFSRTTYLGSRGEPSPVVHNAILNSVARLLQRHFNEIIRLRDQRLDKLTTIQIIKELNQSRSGTGSFAFSGEINRRDEYRHKFPLSGPHVRLLFDALDHYRFSAWPDSRDQANKIIEDLEFQLKMSLKSAVESFKD